MSTFHLVRHGQVESPPRVLVGRTPGVGLHPNGRLKVAQIIPLLTRHPVEALFASPLDRTVESARILSDGLRVPINIAEEIIEVDFGSWTGLSYGECEAHPAWTGFNAFRSGTQIPGGEFFLATQLRAVRFLLGLRDRSPEGTFVVVTHGDVIRASLLYFLGMPIDFVHRIRIDLASVSTVRIDDRDAEVITMNWTP